jgi:hypothetical protein
LTAICAVLSCPSRLGNLLIVDFQAGITADDASVTATAGEASLPTVKVEGDTAVKGDRRTDNGARIPAISAISADST